MSTDCGGGERWELKVVQVHQIRVGVYRPDMLGEWSWQKDFSAKPRVFKLLVLLLDWRGTPAH